MNPMQQHSCERRLEVLAGQARGLTNAQIACELGVSEETVCSLAYRLKNLLGASTAAHTVALAFRYGLLDREPIRPVHRSNRAAHQPAAHTTPEAEEAAA